MNQATIADMLNVIETTRGGRISSAEVKANFDGVETAVLLPTPPTSSATHSVSNQLVLTASSPPSPSIMVVQKRRMPAYTTKCTSG